MNRWAGNRGVVNEGSGTVIINGSAIGDHASVDLTPSARTDSRPGAARCSIALLTVLPVEMRAVAQYLRRMDGYRKRVGQQGAQLHEADAVVDGIRHHIVATQTADQGQRSAVVAFANLVRFHAPALVVLVGIAGAIHKEVRVGDVLIAHEVVYYEPRKEARERTWRRGHELCAPVIVRHAVNDFFSDHAVPCVVPDAAEPGGQSRFRVWTGPIGSGEAVVASSGSDIRTYLVEFNDKMLAVETEAAGVAQALHEMAVLPEAPLGWLTVRGISDAADPQKDDSHHELAARRASVVVELLLPYLLSRLR